VSEALVLWACAACDHVAYPRRLLCPACGGGELRPQPADGGVVEEVTLRRPVAEGEDATWLASVRADAGPVVIARLAGEARPGDRVALRGPVAEAVPAG
jgi:uncharacterized OB-fold protein